MCVHVFLPVRACVSACVYIHLPCMLIFMLAWAHMLKRNGLAGCLVGQQAGVKQRTCECMAVVLKQVELVDALKDNRPPLSRH